MTILAHAYQSSACKDYLLQKTENEVLSALIRNRLVGLRENVWAVAPEEYDATVSVIPVFNYPLVVEHNHEKHVVVDTRNLLSRQTTGTLRARRSDEFQAKVILAQLALDWSHGEQQRIFSINQMPLAVFSGWLGEVIGKRFALNAMSQMQVSILAAIYYINLFSDASQVEAREGAAMLATITRACGWRAGDVITILEAYPVISTLEEFCEFARNHTQDVHLQDLNTITLQGSVGGYWYGNAGRESIAVALEYPPMWLSLVFQAITDRSFKKAGLTTVVERSSYRRHHENFIRALLLKGDLTKTGGAITY